MKRMPHSWLWFIPCALKGHKPFYKSSVHLGLVAWRCRCYHKAGIERA